VNNIAAFCILRIKFYLGDTAAGHNRWTARVLAKDNNAGFGGQVVSANLRRHEGCGSG
jgi:hypothetical protein